MSKTLVVTKNFAPYMKDDVITVTDEQWNAMLGEQVEKGRDTNTNPLLRTCVVEYNPKKEDHVKLLEQQRGKAADADTEPVATADADNRIAQLTAELEVEKANRADAEKAAADAQAAKDAAEQKLADAAKTTNK